MNGEDSANNATPPRIVPIIQMFAIAAVVGLAVADLLIPEDDVSLFVYGLIGSIAIGVAPESVLRVIRNQIGDPK